MTAITARRRPRRRRWWRCPAELLVALLDQQGRGLGAHGHAAGDDLDRAELTERARQTEHHAVQQGPADGRQRDPDKGLQARGAETAGCLLLLGTDLVQHRNDLPDDQWQADERGGQDDPQRRVDHLQSCRFKGPADPAHTAAVDKQQGEADDDRGHRQWHVDHGVQRSSAGEGVADQQQGNADTEDGIDHNSPERHRQGQLEGEDHVGLA
jgi:hypothetical protein